MIVLPEVPMAVIFGGLNDSGVGCPANSRKAGLGSKVSRWLAPPSMNSQMTDLALGA